MFPNIVRFTLGDLYVDQPAVIENVTHQFPNFNWEIEEGNQIPKHVTVTLSFGLLEKDIPNATSKSNRQIDRQFYG